MPRFTEAPTHPRARVDLRAIERAIDVIALVLTRLIDAGAITPDDFPKHVRPRVTALLEVLQREPNPDGGTP